MAGKYVRPACRAARFACWDLMYVRPTSRIPKNGKNGTERLKRPQRARQAVESRGRRDRRQKFCIHVNRDPVRAADAETRGTRVLEVLGSRLCAPQERRERGWNPKRRNAIGIDQVEHALFQRGFREEMKRAADTVAIADREEENVSGVPQRIVLDIDP